MGADENGRKVSTAEKVIFGLAALERSGIIIENTIPKNIAW